MSALAEALVAAQRRAVSAMEKVYVAGALDAQEAKALMESIGLTDEVDQSRLLLALDFIRDTGAQLPAEPKPAANGAPEAKASDAQLARIRKDLQARGFSVLAESDAAKLTKRQASEIIDTLAAGTYEPEQRDRPF